MAKKTIEDIQVKGKKVLVRCDFNVPLDDDKNITDENRIKGALPTIEYLVSCENANGKIICVTISNISTNVSMANANK